ncbi:MAG TPA: electron transfer flavoprotein subunit alpha/FixB family protein [Haloplasmataceae bacterium]
MSINDYKDIYVFIELRENNINEVSFELLGESNRLAQQVKDYEVIAVLLGHNVKPLCQELIEYGADKVIVCEHPLLKEYSTEAYTLVLTNVINQFKPDIFLIGATTLGRDLAPRIAARCNTGLTADATHLEFDKESSTQLLLVTRPAFGGNLFATIVCENNRPQMATIRPKVLIPLVPNSNRKGEIIDFNVNLMSNDIHTKIIDIIEKKNTGIDITKADIIISGGRGVAKNFALLKEIAQELGAAVGASRAVVDEGYAPKEIQVGQTGKTVRPKLYIACGISGAVQHLAGMDKSDYIIAINKDKEAPILKIANLGIVGDALEILPILKDEIIKLKKA